MTTATDISALAQDQIEFCIEIGTVSTELRSWVAYQFLSGRSLDSVKEQLLRVVKIVTPLREAAAETNPLLNGNTTSVHHSYNLAWMQKNAESFVGAIAKVAEDYPATEWRHFIAFQPPGMVELSVVRRAPGEHLRCAIDVNWDVVTNAIVGALEGGCGYWCREYDYIVTPEEYDNPNKYPAYACADFWKKGGVMLFKYDDPDNDGKTAQKHVSESTLRFGLRVMAEKFPRHFGDLVSENDDAATHDVLLQCALFGDVIYG